MKVVANDSNGSDKACQMASISSCVGSAMSKWSQRALKDDICDEYAITKKDSQPPGRDFRTLEKISTWSWVKELHTLVKLKPLLQGKSNLCLKA